MFGIFSRRDVRVQAAVTQGMQLKTIRDTGGYEFGVIWEPTLRQGSVLLKGEESFTLADIAMWRDLICTIEGVQVIATIWSAHSNIETHIPRMLVTFDAGGRKCDDFLTWLAKRLVYVYSPDQMELMWWPQEAEKVKEYASSLWSPDSKPKFPPIAELLKERHSAIQCDSAYRLAFEVLLTASMSEDIVQETLVQAWRSLHLLRDPDAFRGWLMRICTNKATSTIRQLQRRATDPYDSEGLESASVLPNTTSTATDDPAQSSEVNAQIEALAKLLASAPEELRIVWVLREVDDMSYEEISQTLNLTESTVRGRLARARSLVMRQMKEWA